MARPSKVSFSFELSPDLINRVVMSSPRLQEAVFEEIQSSIGAGGKKSGSKRSAGGGTRVRRGLHHEMAVKALAAAGAKSDKAGVNGKIVKEQAKELGHSFGSTLNATLDTLAEKGIVAYKNVAPKGAGKPRYIWWLKLSEQDALAELGGAEEEAAN